MSDSLSPHELQHTRAPCPSPTPGVYSKLMPIESVMPSSHLILCHPLLLLPPIPPSIRVFSDESTFRMRWPKYWSFSFSISPSNEHPGLISFRMDWLDLLPQYDSGIKKRHVHVSWLPSKEWLGIHHTRYTYLYAFFSDVKSHGSKLEETLHFHYMPLKCKTLNEDL